MPQLGQTNELEVAKQVDFGLYLDAGEMGEVLLPKRYVPHGTKVGQWLEVFLYLDSDDKVIATTETPLVKVGGTATLKVLDVNRVGAFLDWGLSKDLLVPYSEQRYPLEVGKKVTVYCYIDTASERIVATTKLDRYLSERAEQGEFSQHQAVELLVASRTDLGYKAVINNSHLGMLFTNELAQPLQQGQRLPGRIKAIRDDGKIDLSVTLLDDRERDELADKIMRELIDSKKALTLTDKSPPAMIFQQFGVSKGNYKKALGGLYRRKLIELKPGRVTLTQEGSRYFDGV